MTAFTRAAMRRRGMLPKAALLAQRHDDYTSAPDDPSLVVGGKAPKKVPLDQTLAPAPIVDRFPAVIGANLSLSYISSVYRLCTTGIRFQFVDVLDELFEHDPHARGIVRQRVIAVAGARLDIQPAELPPDHPETDLAQEIADEVSRQFSKMESFQQSLGALAYGIIYGVSAAENDWAKVYDTAQGRGMWEIRRLRNIHSRRLSYSNPVTWDLHVYDQGLVGPGLSRMGPTTGVYGLRIDDYPGKFTVHHPQLSGGYPTRDGEGRYIGVYMALKRMVVRATAQDFERTIRPWVIGYFGRTENHLDKGLANPPDIEALDRAVKALGMGSLNAATLPDSCKIEILRAASEYSPIEFVAFLDAQMSKSMLGQTFTTEPGKFGSRGGNEVGKQGSTEIARYDGGCIADTLERDVVHHIVRLNYPGKENLRPQLRLLVDEVPDPDKVMGLAVKGSGAGMPVDADAVAALTGVPLVPQEKPEGAPADWQPKPRRMALMQPVALSSVDESIKPPPTPVVAPQFGEKPKDDEAPTKDTPAETPDDNAAEEDADPKKDL